MPEFEEQMESLLYVKDSSSSPTHSLHPSHPSHPSVILSDRDLCRGRDEEPIADDVSRSTESDDPPEPPPELIQTHQSLMLLFGQYEHLSKRISGMPCTEGGNQASVQAAVARSAATFLTKEMMKVQVCHLSSPS